MSEGLGQRQGTGTDVTREGRDRRKESSQEVEWAKSAEARWVGRDGQRGGARSGPSCTPRAGTMEDSDTAGPLKPTCEGQIPFFLF